MSDFVGILLAAGSAARFGSPKLLHPLPDGIPVAVQAARVIQQALPQTIAVVRAGDDNLKEAFSSMGITVVENSRSEQGMGISLAMGVDATRKASGWVVALADMPWIRLATVSMLVKYLQHGTSIVAPLYQGQRGHPVGFNGRWRQALLDLKGDHGARDLLANYQDELELLDIDDPGIIQDIDFPQDLQHITDDIMPQKST